MQSKIESEVEAEEFQKEICGFKFRAEHGDLAYYGSKNDRVGLFGCSVWSNFDCGTKWFVRIDYHYIDQSKTDDQKSNGGGLSAYAIASGNSDQEVVELAWNRIREVMASTSSIQW